MGLAGETNGWKYVFGKPAKEDVDSVIVHLDDIALLVLNMVGNKLYFTIWMQFESFIT